MTTISPAASMVMHHGLQMVGKPGPTKGAAGGSGLQTGGSSGPDTGASGGTATGSVSSSKNGDGSFSVTMTKVGNQRMIDKNVSFANGTSRSSERTVTVNADGSKTISKTNANGKVSTIEESEVKNDDGTISLSKQITKANGAMTQVSGTITKTNGETDRALTMTNSQNQTETIDMQATHTGNITMHSRTGTGYSGNTIDNTSTWTTYA
jgi:hypothetical protein